MQYELLNKSDRDLSDVEEFVSKFYPYAQERLNIDQPVTIVLRSDSSNAKEILGKTGYYDPDNNEVVVYIDDRHPKDILRSISHELIHHAQNCRGEFDDSQEVGVGYAQDDDHMRKMETEAYLLSNGDDLMVFRDFEDKTKKEDGLMSEHVKEDLQQKIQEILEDKEEKEVITEDTAEVVEKKTSDREWYKNSLYESLVKKWAK
tara:strand:- start:103 stop:714 length:612 start_codon:yes stop_codon:yes gene_type:complete